MARGTEPSDDKREGSQDFENDHERDTDERGPLASLKALKQAISSPSQPFSRRRSSRQARLERKQTLIKGA